MTNPITAEVRAALERLRDAKDGNPPWEYAGEDGIEARSDDTELIADAMLSLFPEGMPEPAERFAYAQSGGLVDDGAFLHRHPQVKGVEVVCGLFIPLERITETQP